MTDEKPSRVPLPIPSPYVVVCRDGLTGERNSCGHVHETSESAEACMEVLGRAPGRHDVVEIYSMLANNVTWKIGRPSPSPEILEADARAKWRRRFEELLRSLTDRHGPLPDFLRVVVEAFRAYERLASACPRWTGDGEMREIMGCVEDHFRAIETAVGPGDLASRAHDDFKKVVHGFALIEPNDRLPCDRQEFPPLLVYRDREAAIGREKRAKDGWFRGVPAVVVYDVLAAMPVTREADDEKEGGA